MDVYKGDIIVWEVLKTTPSWISRALAWFFPRFGQGGSTNLPSFSHSAIASAIPMFIYESTWPKTQHAEIPLKDFKNYKLQVYRYEGITEMQRYQIAQFCELHMGEWYDLLEIISLGTINLNKYSACSEFVRKAYQHVGIQLGKDNEYLLSPNELVYETPKLMYIGEMKL